MMDVLMIAIALSLFALAIAYAHAIEKCWGGGRVMVFDYSLAAIVAVGLLVYLICALLRPERFWPLASHQLQIVLTGRRRLSWYCRAPHCDQNADAVWRRALVGFLVGRSLRKRTTRPQRDLSMALPPKR
jgi:K+-transporting ATPase KdpF subunit